MVVKTFGAAIAFTAMITSLVALGPTPLTVDELRGIVYFKKLQLGFVDQETIYRVESGDVHVVNDEDDEREVVETEEDE